MFKKIFAATLLAAMLLSSPAEARPFRGGPIIADRIKTTTVARLPPQLTGRVLVVTDGNSTSDCSTGGGSNKVVCWNTGTSWQAIGSSATDLTSSNTWTFGDGTSGDVVITYDGDAGVDGTQTWDVSEDAFVISRILKLFADSGLDSGGEIDDTGDIGFDISHWDTGRGTILIWDGTAVVGLVGIQISDTCTAGQVGKYQSGGTWTCEDDDDTGAPTITATHVAYATGTNAIGGEAAFYYDAETNTLYVGTLQTAATATPTIKQYDSDTTDGDINIQIVGNCTDTGSGTEDCDLTFSQQIAGVMTAFLTADADGNITIERLVSTTAGNITSTGVIDFGGASSFELPNGTNPTTDAEGECAWDSDNDAIECYNGTASYLVPVLHHYTKTIWDPDTIQATEDAIPLLEVTADWAEFGITIKDIEYAADASNSGTMVLEEWTSPTDGAPSTIESITFSASTEVTDDGTLADASVAAGSFVFIDLDTTALNWLTVSFTYYINPGD